MWSAARLVIGRLLQEPSSLPPEDAPGRLAPTTGDYRLTWTPAATWASVDRAQGTLINHGGFKRLLGEVEQVLLLNRHFRRLRVIRAARRGSGATGSNRVVQPRPGPGPSPRTRVRACQMGKASAGVQGSQSRFEVWPDLGPSSRSGKGPQDRGFKAQLRPPPPPGAP